MRKLGYARFAGGTHFYISKKIKGYGLDTSHFTGQSHKGIKLGGFKKREASNILVLRETGSRAKTVALNRALKEIGRLYQCEICGLLPVWNNKDLRFEIEHKNGNFLDDRQENLCFICPNCHSQTPSFCRQKTLIKRPSVCGNCSKAISKWAKKGLCRKCSAAIRPKLGSKNKPIPEELTAKVKSVGVVGTAKIYNVSHTTIRRWLTQAGVVESQTHCV